MEYEVFDNTKYEKARAMEPVKLSVYLFNSHIVFLVGNAIIVVIVLLCRQTKANNKSLAADFHQGDIRSGDVQQPIVTEVPVSSPAPPPETSEPNFAGDESKQIVCSESTDVDEETETKKIKILERTQSEKLTVVNPKTELRRTKIDMSQIVVRPGARRQIKAVDTLSNEEFLLTIEAFIKKNQIFFETQRLAETEQVKYVN
ncbi:hypothetical protein RND71_038316 [Anisodus tanguticus]|uniref:Uncharacterized protein n=1 Tax=Anisodus tanguticus TaxID=243964 RepID=A0AAE1QZE7_9SOLA|nr:hypothetical protein RND71_038316 [Anisodus tanguticus]